MKVKEKYFPTPIKAHRAEKLANMTLLKIKAPKITYSKERGSVKAKD